MPVLESAARTVEGGEQGTRTTRLWTSPFAIAGVLYAAVTLVHEIASFRACDGHFVYPVDDAYILMAMAKNLALHGIWGVTPFGFSGSSSSLLFPLLMAGLYRIVGITDYLPLVLSWISGLAAIYVAGRILSRFLEPKLQTVLLILFVLCPPLFVLGILGMEHSLHLLLTLLFLDLFLKDDVPAWQAIAISTTMVAARYEGLFFIAPACVILAAQRKWKAALSIAMGAAIPVCTYAAFSVAHGNYWLPQSVALKGAQTRSKSIAGTVWDLLHRAKMNSGDGPWLVLLLIALAASALSVAGRKWSRTALPLVVVFVAGCLHLCLAGVGRMSRYEDYLIGAGIVAIGCAFPTILKRTSRMTFTMLWILFCAAGISLLLRASVPAMLLPACARAIYAQQMQMARFVRTYYPRGSVAANDVGAISYYSDIHCLDVVGLASPEVFFARRRGVYTTDYLQTLAVAQHVQLAIVYDSWFSPERPDLLGIAVPPDWVRVARWSLPQMLQQGGKTVSFYAVVPGETEHLRSALQEFALTLPKEVTVTQN